MAEQSYYQNPELWAAHHFLTPAEALRLQQCADLIPSTTTTLLDVGCGNGAFMAYLEARKTTITLLGIERSEAARQAAVCRAPVQAGSIDSLPSADRAYDLVAAMEVIEHLPYQVYEQSLAELERVAAKHILISVPYRERRSRVICPYCNCRFDSNYHMRRFDEAVMQQLFRSFRLKQFQLVYVDDYWLAPLLRAGYRVISRNRDFPATAQCPQCGFVGRSAANTTANALPARARGGLKAKLKGRLPTYKRANWIVALYERS